MIGTVERTAHNVDVCVIGGGMAGICAAISSARNGATTLLIHDRPVLGGNASSEVRMWICGAHGKYNKEAGVLEELQLENQYRNHGLNYSVWDSVLYAAVHFEPRLTTLLNCTVTSADSAGGRIAGVTAWQLTSQSWHTVNAKLFIDCSGDSILAALTPAEYRVGREACSEFDEDIEPEAGDSRTMGNSLLVQFRRTDERQTFVPPRWAYKFTTPEDLPCRIDGVDGHNFWWIEVGGLQDTIRDAEAIRDELMRIAYGVVDYIKNHAPEKEKAANWTVEWIGSLPGKRENRRYVGDHTLTQNDITSGGVFDDIVAYGGWSMDDHHPAGIYYPGYPTQFHPAPSPYGIPYRCLYSKNMRNLMFAGRNISVTHAALSSTRVMGTCALLGQAAGTAAALCIADGCEPVDLSSGIRLRRLQETIMDDDCWLPGLKRTISPLTLSATIKGNGANTERLIDGLDRDLEGEPHAWSGEPGDVIEYRWESPVRIGGVRLVFDSNLAHSKQMPYTYPQSASRSRVPSSMMRRFRLEALDGAGKWAPVIVETNNYQRLVRLSIDTVTTGLRLVAEETWGSERVRIFAFEVAESAAKKSIAPPDGRAFSEVRAALDPADLRDPAKQLEESSILPSRRNSA